MRISKKFCGDARIGHLRFPRTPKRDLTEEDLMVSDRDRPARRPAGGSRILIGFSPRVSA
eukprot:scaffold273_cov242-Pinguiococcus_pyrenoidosus.AAC.11